MLLVLSFICAENVSGQKKYVWNGEWNVTSRYTPSTLTIKQVSGNRFSFKVEAMNGANMGEVKGVASIKGNKAYFDDRKSTKKDSEKNGCILTFTNKGSKITINQNEKCSYYAGSGVGFEGDYLKGKPRKYNEDFVERGVFPNINLDRKFKLLTGKDYETFIEAFNQVYPEDDIDGLKTTVFSGCVRGICPWHAGIIMFDEKGSFWAAVMNVDKDVKPTVRYYSNVSGWTDKLPKTIENWIEDKRKNNDDLTIAYKSKK
jgi:hypothetical protein